MAVVLVSAAVIGVIALADTASGAGDSPLPAAPTATPEPIDGPIAVLAMTTNMYAAPSRTADLLAIIPADRPARLTGRSEESDWLRVIYPASSSLEGWVPRANVVAASAPDIEDLPAVASRAPSGDENGGGPLLEDDALPDLTISSADVQANGTLAVRITNVGRGTFADVVDVHVTSAEGELLGVLEVDLSQQPLHPGRSAAVNTGVVIRRTGLYVIEVDKLNRVEEDSEFNNTRRVLLVGTGS